MLKLFVTSILASLVLGIFGYGCMAFLAFIPIGVIISRIVIGIICFAEMIDA